MPASAAGQLLQAPLPLQRRKHMTSLRRTTNNARWWVLRSPCTRPDRRTHTMYSVYHRLFLLSIKILTHQVTPQSR